MARRGERPTFEVPNGLGGLCVKVAREQAAAVGLFKDAGEAPGLLGERLHLEDVDDERVAWLGTLDGDRAGEVVDLGQVHVAHVVCVVRVLDLPACPLCAW